MIVQASPREFIIAALNSYANFNLHYWHYADGEKMVGYWIGYREKAENAIEEMAEGPERAEMEARLAEADRVVLADRLADLREEDFVSLPREEVPFARWWWYIDLVKAGFMRPEPGMVGQLPQAVGDLFGFGRVAVEEEAVEVDLSDLTLGKVWIDPGCIVCNACEEICPEVFLVEEETCRVIDEADLALVKDILDAADACPVEVIKWEAA